MILGVFRSLGAASPRVAAEFKLPGIPQVHSEILCASQAEYCRQTAWPGDLLSAAAEGRGRLEHNLPAAAGPHGKVEKLAMSRKAVQWPGPKRTALMNSRCTAGYMAR